MKHTVFRWYQPVSNGEPCAPARLQMGTYHVGELGVSRTYWRDVQTIEVDEAAEAFKQREAQKERERITAEKAARPKWWQVFK